MVPVHVPLCANASPFRQPCSYIFIYHQVSQRINFSPSRSHITNSNRNYLGMVLGFEIPEHPKRGSRSLSLPFSDTWERSGDPTKATPQRPHSNQGAGACLDGRRTRFRVAVAPSDDVCSSGTLRQVAVVRCTGGSCIFNLLHTTSHLSCKD